MLGLDRIERNQDIDRFAALANEVNKLRVPENAGNFLTTFKPFSFPRWAVLCGVSFLVSK